MGIEDVRTVVGRKRTYEILNYLSSSDGRNFTEITAEIDSSSDTIWQTLNLLCEYELIERRERSAKDVRYAITPKGKQVLGEIKGLGEILSSDNAEAVE